MKIIVTGGAGFIASHITDAYINAGHKVVIIDNLSTGFRRNIDPKAKFYKADIRDRAAMDRIFKKERPEIVNHHAAIAEVIKSLRDPIPTFEVNVLGTANVLVAFGEHGRGKNKKLLFASTGGAIYGEPENIPAAESTPRMPLSPYGLSKLLDEELVLYYARYYGFSYTIFRYANVYGPRQNPKGEAGVVAIFGRLLKTHQRPTIFGDGSKTRDYVYVEDIARASILALKKGGSETLNLGWGKPISDQMIFNTIAGEAGFDGKPIYAPHRAGEVLHITVHAHKAHKTIGWKPMVTFKEGIKRTVATL